MFHGVDRVRCWDRRTILGIWLLSVLSVLAINPSSPASSVVEAITDRRTLGSEKGTDDASILADENARRLEGDGSRNVTYWNETSVPLCCPLETRMAGNRCIETNGTFHFPPLYDSQSFTLLKETPTLGDFRWYIRNPCQGDSYKLDPSEMEEDAFMFLDNGSVYKSLEKNMIDQDTYCFGIVDTQAYDVVLCFTESEDSGRIEVAFPAGMLLSAPFLFVTFLVYTLIPELKNMHGRTLRGYVGSLLVAYVLLAVVQIAPGRSISDTACLTLGTLFPEMGKIFV